MANAKKRDADGCRTYVGVNCRLGSKQTSNPADYRETLCILAENRDSVKHFKQKNRQDPVAADVGAVYAPT